MKFATLIMMLTAFFSHASELKKVEKLDEKSTAPINNESKMETITLGAGCFWCIEAAYRQINGVKSAVSGYMGGSVANPSYEQVCEGNTGHAEVVQLTYDPQVVDAAKILAWFWDLHDPTTLNRQGNDVGSQYRSVIFYHSEKQKEIAQKSKLAAQANFKSPIVTEIVAAGAFYKAEDYHQDYYKLNKSKNPYCRFVIEPKLKKLKLDH